MKRLPPLYPAAIAVAYVLTVFSGGPSPAADLLRPLLVAVAVALVVQLVATVLVHDRDVGALIAGLLIAAVPDSPFVFVALLSLLAFLTIPGLVARARGGIAKPAPWRSATRLVNLIATVAVVVAAGQLLVDGRFRPGPAIAQPLGPANAAAPDIYVILLDGHPAAGHARKRIRIRRGAVPVGDGGPGLRGGAGQPIELQHDRADLCLDVRDASAWRHSCLRDGLDPDRRCPAEHACCCPA